MAAETEVRLSGTAGLALLSAEGSRRQNSRVNKHTMDSYRLGSAAGRADNAARAADNTDHITVRRTDRQHRRSTAETIVASTAGTAPRPSSNTRRKPGPVPGRLQEAMSQEKSQEKQSS